MITLDNVTKFYKTAAHRKFILRNQTMHFASGRSYGLLGVNGAGKSTTMRLISGAELPNKGRVRRQVRVSWPLGFANGLNHQLSGKENLKFVARAYGEDFHRVLRFVAEFAEIGSYLNEPLRTYSSGMAARFAFGLSMAIEFDCYLVDEITAVGDSNFQRRCREAFMARRAKSDVIMISHDMNTIKDYCDAVVVLIDGHMMQFDNVEEGIATYMRLNR
ncbi:ABC transporter ATP-binding protein [Allorhizobium taibaishanense]|uniref:ABC transporter ATP-binding protein n=1 Tax=Allorhizobium taibaishanense TaxID=887144 RepID=A0A1Q9ABX5_9HYPH|nr:ATP-binding cassette domain-containing protein [Allorhizobium taibaishanense]MBB4010249.1 capsular polysaccharide transport system ATP-binding protein [Allorhizobium taibaishanense]OLP52364.1 ABC transporter ATP-binding protein [Allorhizobium taibaishanense]